MGSLCTRRASARPRAAAPKAGSYSSGPRTSNGRSCIRRPGATPSISFHAGMLTGLAGSNRTATRRILGTISRTSSSCFVLNSGLTADNPVTFPPGLARLATSPVATGSPVPVMTMGIVPVSCLAAPTATVLDVTMMSTLRRTRSAARSRRRSSRPSAYRYSMTMFFPST